MQDQFCPNGRCKKYKRKGLKSVIRYGTQLRCSACGRTWARVWLKPGGSVMAGRDGGSEI